MLKKIRAKLKLWNLMHKESLIHDEMIELDQASDYIAHRKQSLWMMKCEIRKQLAEVSQ